MKKNVLISITALLLLIAGALGVFFILKDNNNEVPPETGLADIEALIRMNEDTVFSYLTEEKKQLPENMKGYVVDTVTDIDFSVKTSEALRKSVAESFEKVNAINPDTIVIKYDTSSDCTAENTDAVECIIKSAEEKNLFTVLFIDTEKYTASYISELAEKYSPDAVMVNARDFSQSAVKNVTETKKALNEKDIFFGTVINGNPTKSNTEFINGTAVDFCFISIDTTIAQGAENTIKTWAKTAISGNCRFYALLKNDLLLTDENWNRADEIYKQLRAVNNHGGFSGCIFNSHKNLKNNFNKTTSDFYFYNEYFNDSTYTSLTISSFSVENNSVIRITGTADRNFPVLTWCTADGKWKNIETQGDEGNFTAEIKLRDGKNKITLRHKNALYTYHINKAVDVMKEQSATINEGILTLSVKAVKGASVTAAVANTDLIELTEQPSEEKYATFTATYEIPASYGTLATDQISYAATYNGLNDIVMCGKEKPLSPYDDHSLGNADMCFVTTDYAETTVADSPDDSSDPLCTPQIKGAYAYVTGYSVNSNNFIYSTDTGMKIHGDCATLILGAYVMPENRIKIDSVKTDNDTTLTFSASYIPFIKTATGPQEYKKGMLDREYNVDAFTGEYIDITFMHTNEISYINEPDFSQSDVIEKAEWHSDSENSSMTLRLYFRTKADFAGYSLRGNGNGIFSLKLKKTADNLSGTVIMLDPGHGGYGAPGTYSTSSVYEHEVVYSIAQKAADILREKGATVILTRGNDEPLFLDERVDMIREYDPDVFASIHCDGSDNTSWFGTHTFYYRNYSMPLADAIHKQMVSSYRNYVYTDPTSKEYENVDMECKFFPYMVTRVEECPSVLIECGYLTNETDAAFLTSENGQLITATAIAQGIVDYIAGS
ncbi:MAG: N-acetylmuramoyl-L-alanine amidase [Clostridia bacterium]|nr:N-acetylmuramoyl-L-alanine amidase [Clostridia bacterium]